MGYSYILTTGNCCNVERCPYCGSRAINLRLSDKGDITYRGKGGYQCRTPSLYYVGCDRCGGRTADFAEIGDAIDAWNKRAHKEAE